MPGIAVGAEIVTAAHLASGAMALPAGCFVEGDSDAGRANAHMGNIVESQRGAIRAGSVEAEGCCLRAVAEIVVVTKPRGEMAGKTGLRSVVGHEREVARQRSCRPGSASALPWTIVGAVLVLAGALSIAVGLVLHTVARHFQELDLHLQLMADEIRGGREPRR